MCMSSANFKLKWSPEEKAWIGTGYKTYDVLNKSGKLDWRRSSIKGMRMGIWLRANSHNGSVQNLKDNNLAQISLDSNSYPRGFHIWTELQSATAYRSNFDEPCFEVIYKNVIAFGKNYANYTLKEKDCVIAEYMKIVKRLRV